MNYRDDMTDTMHTYSSSSAQLKMLAEAKAKADANAQANLVLLVTDGLSAADPVEQRQTAVPVSAVEVAAAIETLWQARQVAGSRITASDGLHALLVQLIDESGELVDTVAIGQTALPIDRIDVTADLSAMQAAVQTLIERVKVTGDYAPIFRFIVDEVIRAADETTAQQVMILLMVSALRAEDAFLQQAVANALAEAHLIVSDETALHIEARLALTERAWVDADLSAGAQAAGWTANVSTWATSRYLPYDFDSLAVIDGHLYGTARDGVYRLDDEEAVEEIHAMLRTGQIEVSPDVLARLESVYCLYQSRAEVTLAVEQTQPGREVERYEYTLPDKAAEVMTTGRFKLGKGLRGRTFTFELNAQGEKANFAELDLIAESGKRRL